LLPKADNSGRVLATEVMVVTPGIRNLIREQAIEQIPTAIQTGSAYGMNTMDKSLQKLYQEGTITYETAMENVKNKEEFRQLLSGSKTGMRK
jgi:twitching motility protein PilT